MQAAGPLSETAPRARLSALSTISIAGLLALAGCAGRGPLYDTHAHFFTADTSHFPLDTRGAREGERALAERVRAHPNDAGTVLREWHTNHVTGGVGVQYASAYKSDNRYLLYAHARHPHDIAAVVVIDPLADDTPETLARMSANGGIVGIRLTGTAGPDGDFPWIDSPKADRTWAAARDIGLVVVIMALPAVLSERQLSSVAAIADRYPSVTIVLDHVAWSLGPAPDYGLDAAARVLADKQNVTFKFTTINVDMIRKQGEDPAAYLRRAVDLFGADRLMWGSDFGNSQKSYAAMVADIRHAGASLTPTERRKVFRDTGLRLFHKRHDPTPGPRVREGRRSPLRKCCDR
jgi:predicted TIM-barrel fold metal-dependent hydrolase